MTEGIRLEERYVDAVLASIPDAQRADVEAELRASIADASEARMELGESAEAATTSVLEGLGDPGVLAAELAGRPLWLIGPRQYLAWARLLRLLLGIVVPIVGVAVAVLAVVGGGTIVDGLVSGIASAAGAAIHVMFWVTVVFAILERTGETGHLAEWTIDDLSSRDSSISLGETVWSVASSVGVIALLVVVDRGLTATIDGSDVAVFAPGIWDLWVPVVIGLLAVDAVFEIVKYRTGRWTSRLAVANLVVNVAFASVVAWLLLSGRSLHPDLVAAVEAQITDPNARTWLDLTLWITVAVVIVVATWRAIDGFVKVRRRR